MNTRSAVCEYGCGRPATTVLVVPNQVTMRGCAACVGRWTRTLEAVVDARRLQWNAAKASRSRPERQAMVDRLAEAR